MLQTLFILPRGKKFQNLLCDQTLCTFPGGSLVLGLTCLSNKLFSNYNRHFQPHLWFAAGSLGLNLPNERPTHSHCWAEAALPYCQTGWWNCQGPSGIQADSRGCSAAQQCCCVWHRASPQKNLPQVTCGVQWAQGSAGKQSSHANCHCSLLHTLCPWATGTNSSTRQMNTQTQCLCCTSTQSEMKNYIWNSPRYYETSLFLPPAIFCQN